MSTRKSCSVMETQKKDCQKRKAGSDQPRPA